MPATPVLGANTSESWVWWSWVGDHLGDIGAGVREHLVLTAIAVAIGLVIALPLAIVVHRWRAWTTPVFAVTGILYTIPSLALFALLLPATGLSRTTAVIPLVSYTLLILIRNTAIGLGGVSPEVREAAQGMGFGSAAQLVRVEMPLAVPAIIAGVRIATVTTIGLVPITALIGQGGLGQFILDGLRRDFKTPLVVGTALSVVLAVTADLLLLLLQRVLTPWSHRRLVS